MSSESLIASTTQFQTLLIAFVLIVAVIYFFIELRRIDMRISSLEGTMRKILNEGIPPHQPSAANNQSQSPMTIINIHQLTHKRTRHNQHLLN